LYVYFLISSKVIDAKNCYVGRGNKGAEHKYIVYMQLAVYDPESTYQLP